MPPEPPTRPEEQAGADGAGVVVPLRSFTLGKARLAPGLDPWKRAALAQEMAERVVEAAGDRPLVVVSSADEVLAWAHARSIPCIPDPGSLDAAAAAGRAWVAAQGCARVVVAHGDLPLAESLDPVAGDGAEAVAALVPCHRGDGTPVLAVPVASTFRFAYGPGSYARHRTEAARCGLRVRVVDEPGLAFDVDVPTDLALLAGRTRREPV